MERIAIIGENSIEYINLLLNIWNNGDCAVLLDWRIPLTSAARLMKDAHVHKCYIDNKIMMTDSYSEMFIQECIFNIVNKLFLWQDIKIRVEFVSKIQADGTSNKIKYFTNLDAIESNNLISRNVN